MKLVYLHQYFVFPEGSGGTRSYDLATSFLRKGYDVEVITSSAFIKDIEYSNGWNVLHRNGLKLHILNLDYNNQMSYSKRIFVFLQFLCLATFKLISIKSDVVLATSTPLTIGIPALFKKWVNRTPFILEVRDVWPEAVIAVGAIKNRFIQKLLFFLERTLYTNSSAVVPLSIDMKKSILRRYPSLLNKDILVIENISEISRFQKVTNEHRYLLDNLVGFKPRFTILYAGTFGLVNGIEYVIDLASRTVLLDEGIVYVLFGNGSEKHRITKLASDKSLLNKNVFIFDPIPKKDLSLLYQQVNMGSSFVIGIKELWANSANKFFDTLAASKPVLINHPGWQKDIILEKNIGYVLPETLDEESLKQFVRYTQDDKLANEQKGNALKVAQELYSLDIAVEKYVCLFDKVIKNV